MIADDPDHDIALIAGRYGTDHHELLLRPNAVELLPAVAAAFDGSSGRRAAARSVEPGRGGTGSMAPAVKLQPDPLS